MKSKETKKIQRIEEKISRLLIEKQKIRSSTCRSKPLSKARRLMIFRIFGWKIAIAKHKNTRDQGITPNTACSCLFTRRTIKQSVMFAPCLIILPSRYDSKMDV
jgi:hypothetical protein